VKLPDSEGQKATCSPFYVEYRPNKNAAKLCKTGHTKGRSHMRGLGLKKETEKVNMVDVHSTQEWTQNF
jgi:hypothetical protein